MNASNKVVYRNTLYLYVMTGAKFVLPLVITACLTRRLGPDSYGVISYLTPVMGYFVLLFDFGFNFSATKKISQNRGDKALVNEVIAAVYTAKLLLALAGLVMLMILLAGIELLRNYRLLTILYYAATVVQIFVPDFLYRGLEKMQAITTRYILAKLITAILIFTVVQNDSQLLLVPLFYLVGTLGAAVYTNWHLVAKLGYTLSLAKGKAALKELQESTVYFASTFATTALTATNVFVMGIVNLPTIEIAYWGVAFQVIQAVQAMYEPITTSIYPHVAAKKDYRFVLRVTGVLFPVVVVGCAVMYGCSGLVVRIIAGREYGAAASVLRYLVPLLLFSFVAQMLGFPLLGAVGREKQVTLTTLVTAVFHLLGIAALILAGTFSLLTLAVLRSVSEFVFMMLRIGFVALFLREMRAVNGAPVSSAGHRTDLKVDHKVGRKVGQVTMHNYNFGSALQCYATQQLVGKRGYPCVLFRLNQNSGGYRVLYLFRAVEKMILHPGHVTTFLRMMKAQSRNALSALNEQDFQGIQKFVDEDIVSVQLSYREMKKAAQSEEYLTFLSGSDQIWNGSWFLKNNLYFLRFAPPEKRIAWAPSFGADRVAAYNQRYFKKAIGAYHCLSVREKSGVEIIKSLTGQEAVELIDPVLQIPAAQWREAYMQRNGEGGAVEYLFCGFIDEPCAAVLKYLRQRLTAGVRVVAFASHHECLARLDGVVFADGSPWDYLQHIDQAAEVCSDSFHTLAFSLLFHKSVYIFRRNYLHNSDQSGRILSLLEKVDLEECFVADDNPLPDVPPVIDFTAVDEILNQERRKANDYLTKALKEGG